MKILIVSASDVDGGGAVAAYRLHRGLLEVGCESSMLVQTRKTDDPLVSGPITSIDRIAAKIRPDLDQMPVRRYPDRNSMFSPGWLPDWTMRSIRRAKPDVVHLHWVNAGFMNPATIAVLPSPVVWTQHDMWAFTGGCHYDAECGRFRTGCGECPALGSGRLRDLSAKGLTRKQDRFARQGLTLVAPSNWMASQVRESLVFGRDVPIEVIANGIDLAVYRPRHKGYGRDVFQLPKEAKIILFGAVRASDDRRKGFHLLAEALKALRQSSTHSKVHLAVFGASNGPGEAELGFPTTYIGRLHDQQSLACLYSCADVFVAPSLQDNLPNTVVEAAACGVPVVAFRIGGMPDMIDHRRSGYLAEAFDTDDLAAGLKWILDGGAGEIGVAARSIAEDRFDLRTQARRHADLYARVVADGRGWNGARPQPSAGVGGAR